MSDQTAPDPESSPLELAQAIDQALDNVAQALEQGDTDTAAALLVAAEETSDSLLDALGAPEADDTPEPENPPAPEGTPAAAHAGAPEPIPGYQPLAPPPAPTMPPPAAPRDGPLERQTTDISGLTVFRPR